MPLTKKVLPAKATLSLHSRACNNKKAPPINQRSLSYMHRFRETDQLLRLTYLSRICGMELAPAFPMPREEVAKASQGHYPLPFLISDVKELMQR